MVNVFVYGSLVHPKEWNKVVSKKYKFCIGEVADSRYYLDWTVKVCTREHSKYHQKNYSTMLTMKRSKFSQPKNVIGVVYFDVSEKDWNKLIKRENFYKQEKIKIKCTFCQEDFFVKTFVVLPEHEIKEFTPRNYLYEKKVITGYNLMKIDVTDI
tara:strand:- start:148 stop:612 length:465 start_codon:yes stop_codon:yes gene_type:complete